jgi:hypothetical protein
MCTVSDINVSKTDYVCTFYIWCMYTLQLRAFTSNLRTEKRRAENLKYKYFPNFLAKNHLDLAGVVGGGGAGGNF